MNWDKIISEKVYLATKNSPPFSRLAIIGARRLVWFLAGLILVWVFIKNFFLILPGRGEGELLIIIMSVVAAWLAQLLIAFAIRRRRPFQQNHEKPLMKLMIPTPSFPSGHTTIACAMAASVWTFDPLVGSLFFIVAALVALCRVAIGVHYLTDIIGGAVLGIGLATTVSLMMLK